MAKLCLAVQVPPSLNFAMRDVTAILCLQVASLPHLATLDVGNNLIKQISGFEALQGQACKSRSFAVRNLCQLAGLLWLTNLNVRGNVSEGQVATIFPCQGACVWCFFSDVTQCNRRGVTIPKRRSLGRRSKTMCEAADWQSQGDDVPDQLQKILASLPLLLLVCVSVRLCVFMSPTLEL